MTNFPFKEPVIDVTNHIEKFRHFLITVWEDLENLMEYHDWDNDGKFIHDWLQINWELLVERELLGKNDFLASFGYKPLDFRISRHNNKPNYFIQATSDKAILDLKGNFPIPFEKGLRLKIFLAEARSAYGPYPPFDVARLILDSTNELFLAPVSLLRFKLVKFKN